MQKMMWLLLIAFTFCGLSFAAPSVDISGTDLLDKKTIRLSPGEKGTVVVFLSAKCPCSNSHVEEVISLSKEFPEFKFVAVHSNTNEDEAASKAYFEAKKIPFAVIQDSKLELADRFKALKTPHAFVLDPKGNVVYQGGVSSSAEFSRAETKFLRDALGDLHENRPVKVSNGRTLGCIIQRS